jgi:hypothetical protein
VQVVGHQAKGGAAQAVAMAGVNRVFAKLEMNDVIEPAGVAIFDA